MSLSAPSTWTQEHLRGAQRLAHEDAETMERLSRLLRACAPVRSETRQCRECPTVLAPTAHSDLCRRCQNRLWERANRKPPSAEAEAARNRRRREARLALAQKEAAGGNDHRLRTIQGVAAAKESP